MLASLLLIASAEAGSYVGTFYQAAGAQTDSTPHLSACGPTRAPWTQIAVTKNLLRIYPCGSAVSVSIASMDGRLHRRFSAVVWDVMPGRGNRIDILVGPREDAARYGRVRVTLKRH